MALGTITIGTEAGGAPSQSVFHEQFTMVGDSAYTTGGTLLFGATLAAAFPLRSFSAASIVTVRGGSTGYVLEYIPSTGALKAYVRTTGVEVANTTDLSGVTFDMYAVLK
jgi:hypothetical protein